MDIKDKPDNYFIVDGRNTVIFDKRKITIYADKFPGRYVYLYFDYYYNPYIPCFIMHEIYNGLENYYINVRNNESKAFYVNGYTVVRNLIINSLDIYKCDKNSYNDNLLTIFIGDYIIKLFIRHNSILLDSNYNIYNPLIKLYLIKVLEPLLFDNHTIPCKIIDRKHARIIVEIYN